MRGAVTRSFLLAFLTALSVAAPVSAQEPIPPTRMPNGATTPAEGSRTEGPGWVCLIDNGVSLAAGETAWIDYVGLHWAAWRVIGPNGRTVVREGNSWAVPDAPGQAVPDRRGRRIVRYGAPGAIRYLIYGVVEAAGPEPRPSVWVEGPALTGTAADHAFLDRIEPRPRSVPCKRRVIYGFFFDEPRR